MAIEKSIAQAPSRRDKPTELDQLDSDDKGSAVEIAVVNPEVVSMQTEEGGVIIDFYPGGEEVSEDEHGANLAEFCDDYFLQNL